MPITMTPEATPSENRSKRPHKTSSKRRINHPSASV